MGRLALRAGWGRDDIEFVVANDPALDVGTAAVLTEFDSIHGRWEQSCAGAGEELTIGGKTLRYLRHDEPRDLNWKELGVDLVLECSGKFRTRALLEPHLENGAQRILVSAAVKDIAPNIVVGVNDGAFDLGREEIVTAASCTTNCLAPVVRILHDGVGIERGTVTTIHSPTNTQRVIDAPHKDPRRARASQLNLIPTSSNSSYAVTLIIPELAGKLESLAVRVPVFGASITDAVFAVSRETTIEEVNELFRAAATSAPLEGILGYEERPLVSTDFATDPRSGIVDGLSTRVTDRTLVKVLAWYDNEWGYANRLAELAGMIARRA